jgi:hypothetical protein
MNHANLAMLEQVALNLGELLDKVVFLGGAVTSLFLTDPAAASVRFTQDVDVIFEATSRADYHALEAKLRKKGFINDMSEDAPICRWLVQGIKVDIMPIDKNILGFGNQWYPLAIKTAQNKQINPQLSIRLVTPICFLATKIEAFEGRGKCDYWASSDLEDIIILIDGRPEIVQEVQAAEPELRDYLVRKIQSFLQDDREALSGHFALDEVNQQRFPIIKKRLEQCCTVVVK